MWEQIFSQGWLHHRGSTLNLIKSATVNWFTTIVRCTIFSWSRSALNSSLNLNRQFGAIKRWTLLFYTSKQKTMVDRTNADMLILEFLSVTKPSRRHEVKEWLDALTEYDDSEFHARFRLSKLTVQHLLSHSSSAVLLHHNTIPIRRKSRKIYNFQIPLHYRWHGVCWLQCSLHYKLRWCNRPLDRYHSTDVCCTECRYDAFIELIRWNYDEMLNCWWVPVSCGDWWVSVINDH